MIFLPALRSFPLARYALSLLLFSMLWGGVLFAEDSSEEDEIPGEELSTEEMYKLGKQLDELGYRDSALSYFKLLLSDPKLKTSMKEELLERVDELEATREEKKGSSEGLEEIDGFERFKVTTALKSVKHPIPAREEDFPRTRINRKKWFWGSVAVILISGYVIHKVIESRDDDEDVRYGEVTTDIR